MPQLSTQGKPIDLVDGATPRLLRVDEVAHRLSVSRSMAWKMIAHGGMRLFRIGRAVRVRPQDLEEYLAGVVREG